MPETTVRTDGPEESEALARRLARGLEPGDLILLGGPLGAGKTTFTRGLLKGLDHPDPREVASPTFALHHRYEGGRLAVDHLDLYRIGDVAAASRQGLLDPLQASDGVCVVEWWERLERSPDAAIVITIELCGEESRRFHVQGEVRITSLAEDGRNP